MPLQKEFFRQNVFSLAESLLGKKLVREIDGQKLIARIVEVEAYAGPEDKGCHAYQNKRTERTEVMFWPGGYTYVYLIYGLHNLLNIVASEADKPEAVLIRACEPVEGVLTMAENRGITLSPDIKAKVQKGGAERERLNSQIKKLTRLTNGPGKLTEALAIDCSWNGYDLTDGKELYLLPGGLKPEEEICQGKRINIDYAEEYKEKPWRYYIKSNAFVSC